MRSFTYLIYNLLVFIPVLVLSYKTDVKPHFHWRALLVSYILVSLPFIIWDIWAVSAGHWAFNSEYVLSPRIFGLPIEEYLFFITVPFALIYTWGVVKKFVADRLVGPWWPLLILACTAGLSIFLLVTHWSSGYTRSAALLVLLTVVILAFSHLIFVLRFWMFQIALLALFVVANLLLTALPVITYGDQSITGVKFFTIPIEDFLYNFAFGTLFLICFDFTSRTRQQNYVDL